MDKRILVILIATIGLTGCAGSFNAEYDQLITEGDFLEAKRLMQRQLEEYALRGENPTLSLRRAQTYYWLAYAHGKLGEYDSMKVALLLATSNDPGLTDSRLQILKEFSLAEYQKGVAFYNTSRHGEAQTSLQKAVNIAGADTHPVYAGGIYRYLAFSAAAAGQMNEVVEYCRRGTSFGDEISERLLEEYQRTGTITSPGQLEDRGEFSFSGKQAPAPPPDTLQRVQELPPEPEAATITEGSQDTTGSQRDPSRSKVTFPWTAHTLDQSTIRRLPFRGIDQYLSILSGVVHVNGGLHIRGSRHGETGYLLDGISVMNPMYNSNGVPLIPEAIDELEVHTGAFGPELGSMSGGMINMRMKTGGDRLQYSFDIQTDDVVATGSQFGIGAFKANSYGYRTMVGTVGGPLPWLGIRFFLAGENQIMRNRQPMFLEPFKYELVTDNLSSYSSGIPLPYAVEFRENYLPGNRNEQTTIQGNAMLEFSGVRVKITGSYSDEEFPNGSEWPSLLQNYFRQKRNMITRNVTKFVSLQAAYSPLPNLQFDLSYSIFDRYSRTIDPDFRHNWILYSDSLANAQKGYFEFWNRYSGPSSYSTIFQFSFNHPAHPNNTYSKENQSSTSWSASLAYHPSPAWQLRAGIKLESWTMRSYRIRSIQGLLSYMDSNRDGVWDRTFNSEYERRVYYIRNAGVRTMGYQYDDPGKTVESGSDKPAKPFFASAYIGNTFKHENLTVDLGARYELFDVKATEVPKTFSPVGGIYDWWEPPIDPNLSVLIENQLIETEPYGFLLPRLSLSFRISEQTELHALYGKYAQMTPLNNVYLDNITLSHLFNPLTRVPYNLGGDVVGFTARPEQTTHYELSLRREFSNRAAVSLRYFYKSLNDQLQLKKVYSSWGNPLFVALLNEGKGTASGVELTFELNVAERFFGRFDYGYSSAQGRFSDARSAWRHVSDDPLPPIPEHLIPFTYDQTHRGSLMAGLEFLEQDGPVLSGLGLNLLFTFRSGQRYTPAAEIQNVGAASVWMIGTRYLVDQRSFDPTAEENSATTEPYFNLDLQLRKKFSFGFLTAELYVNILNVFNRKHILNVYPVTGSPTDDSWLRNPYSDPFKEYAPLYEEFYRIINEQNRWAYVRATGNDIYGTPRQIRIGLNVEM